MASLNEVLDAANNLSIDDQEALVNILRYRVAERRKAPKTRSAEFDALSAPKTLSSKSIEVDDILNEIEETTESPIVWGDSPERCRKPFPLSLKASRPVE